MQDTKKERNILKGLWGSPAEHRNAIFLHTEESLEITDGEGVPRVCNRPEWLLLLVNCIWT